MYLRIALRLVCCNDQSRGSAPPIGPSWLNMEGCRKYMPLRASAAAQAVEFVWMVHRACMDRFRPPVPGTCPVVAVDMDAGVYKYYFDTYQWSLESLPVLDAGKARCNHQPGSSGMQLLRARADEVRARLEATRRCNQTRPRRCAWPRVGTDEDGRCFQCKSSPVERIRPPPATHTRAVDSSTPSFVLAKLLSQSAMAMQASFGSLAASAIGDLHCFTAGPDVPSPCLAAQKRRHA
ncbi:hypothetical protein TARUN_3431 [Trichoderma arundinaceum]|uniref:Uncharacterized protein n=1 Tax=Trichoderma arundinaceum TaxID=490622 RepID=A0A395NRT0_TRIAR|nr:hypothetical protein TARUN_3431 [Trichoderma arundinaceum]